MPEVQTPTRTAPSVAPVVEPIRRYNPDEDHCPVQRTRTVRRIRRVITP